MKGDLILNYNLKFVNAVAEPMILPTIFNVDNNVAEPDIIALFNVKLLAVTFPDTFNELFIVDALETNKLVKFIK